MTELLRKFAAFLNTLQDADVRVAVRESASDDELPAQSDFRTVGADLEGRAVDPVFVGEPEPGPITCFLDGIQRPCGPVYVNSPVPILYGFTAAAIRCRREDSRMRLGACLVDESLYLPHKLADSGPYARAGIGTVDTCDDEEPDRHPLMLLEKAKKKVSARREHLESALTGKWLSEYGGSGEWLLVDGSINGDYSGLEPRNVVGVIKSHSTQYFDWEDQCRVFSLKVGERSGVFVPGGRKRPPVYSWYLRLYPSEGRDVYFGLVRVEAAKCEETLESADRISRWLLAERCPLSLPDARWDRMLYPIYDCEQYLKSIAPPHETLKAVMLSLARAGEVGVAH